MLAPPKDKKVQVNKNHKNKANADWSIRTRQGKFYYSYTYSSVLVLYFVFVYLMATQNHIKNVDIHIVDSHMTHEKNTFINHIWMHFRNKSLWGTLISIHKWNITLCQHCVICLLSNVGCHNLSSAFVIMKQLLSYTWVRLNEQWWKFILVAIKQIAYVHSAYIA